MSSNSNKYMTSPGRMSLPLTVDDYPNNLDDDVSVDDFDPLGPTSCPVAPAQATDAKTLERLKERSYVRDWRRLGLCNAGGSPQTSGKPPADQFRLTSVNSIYMMCRRYLQFGKHQCFK